MFFVKGRANWRLTRLFVLLAVVIVLLSVFGMAGFASEADIAEPECYQSGDLNGDGEFNTKDAIYPYTVVSSAMRLIPSAGIGTLTATASTTAGMPSSCCTHFMT
jgi:hypothetical protein